MRLHRLKIKGLRRLKKIEIFFGDATFLIGQNNSGKSTVFKAIEILLSAQKQLPSSEYYSVVDPETGETKLATTLIEIEGEFRNLPEEAKRWRGFKGRIFDYESEDETGLSVTYRKTYELGKDVIIEFKSKTRELNEVYSNCKTPRDYIDAGVQQEVIESMFDDLEKKVGKSKAALQKLEELDEIWEIEDEDVWFQNPGGIPGNILKMLPRLLLIPVDTSMNEIQGTNSGVLGKTLNELFQTVRENSENFRAAQEFLDKLAKELDPSDDESEFGKMMSELNNVLTSVFPESKLHATTDLSDPQTSLKPIFDVEMSSNIRTPVDNQGTGMVRAAVFGMLRFRQKWLSQKEDAHDRSLIICFEEPEIYLHPSAANQMRDAIYELSSSSSQIVSTTHSPFLIDLARKPKQVLNRLITSGNSVKSKPFTVSDAFKMLQDDDKHYVKMLLKIDDYISRVFFANEVVVIEGDTEDILIRESLDRLEKEQLHKIISNFEIVKARGKASIIGLVKYLTSMDIKPTVVHDRDQGIENAFKFNKPISDAVEKNGSIVIMNENVEDEIGYEATYEKPFNAYKQTLKWGENWEDIPEKWRDKMSEIFGDYVKI